MYGAPSPFTVLFAISVRREPYYGLSMYGVPFPFTVLFAISVRREPYYGLSLYGAHSPFTLYCLHYQNAGNQSLSMY